MLDFLLSSNFTDKDVGFTSQYSKVEPFFDSALIETFSPASYSPLPVPSSTVNLYFFVSLKWPSMEMLSLGIVNALFFIVTFPFLTSHLSNS